MARSFLSVLRGLGRSVLLKIFLIVFRSARPHLIDVFFAYRLLLDRSPDREGWDHYGAEIDRTRYPLSWLVECFLKSPEFLGKQKLGRNYETVPVRQEIARAHGFQLLIDANDTIIGATIKKTRKWEPELESALEMILKPDQVFVDVGANIGFFTLLASRIVGPRGKVIAIEPMEPNYALLEKSLELNRVTNVELHKLALAGEDGKVSIGGNVRYNSGSFHLGDRNSSEGPTYFVEGRRLDSLVADRRIDVIKIDVEGAEGIVLPGMTDTLRRCRPLLFLEYSNKYLEDVSGIPGADLLGRFSRLDYGFQPAESVRDGLTAWSIGEIDELLSRRNVVHLNLLLFPLTLAGRRPSQLSGEWPPRLRLGR